MGHVQSRWWVLVAALGSFGCGTSSSSAASDTDESCPVGTLNCPCTSGGACDVGLECRADLCVPPSGTTMTSGTSTSGSDGSSTGAATTGMSGTTTGTSDSSGSSGGGSTGGGSGSTGGPVCGDGNVDANETCDDGNQDDCDGCESCAPLYSLDVDGVEQHYVEIADVAGEPLSLTNGPFTVEAWVRLDGSDYRIDVGRRGGANDGWRLAVLKTEIHGTVFNKFGHVALAGIVDTGWHHVAWTYDMVKSKLYLDGQLVGEENRSVTVEKVASPVKIGALDDNWGTTVDWGRGHIDEIRVSSGIRYGANFSPERRHVNDANTLGLWHLDEGSGNAVIDSSSFGHTGTAMGVTWAADDGYGGLFCN